MAYKMICLDLDGTLLDKESKLNNTDINTLRKCLEKGIYVYIVTGRPYFFARYIANLISKDVRVIASNGGCYELNDEIVERHIDKEVLDEIIDTLVEDDMHAFYKNKEEIYTLEDPDPRFIYDSYNDIEGFPHTKSYNSLSVEELKEKAQAVDKILVYNMDPEVLISSRAKTTAIKGTVVSSYSNISFDVNSSGTTKGAIIEVVAKELNISTDEIIAYGDGENDIPMFKVCGHKVAMENGHEELKKLADEITLDYIHAGVSHSLKQIFDIKD